MENQLLRVQQNRPNAKGKLCSRCWWICEDLGGPTPTNSKPDDMSIS